MLLRYLGVWEAIIDNINAHYVEIIKKFGRNCFNEKKTLKCNQKIFDQLHIYTLAHAGISIKR